MDWVIPLAFQGNQTDPRASPILAEDLSGLAPATIITAELCPLRDEGKAYANRLRKAGVPTLYYCYESQIHGFLSFGAICEESTLGITHIAGILKHAFRTKAAKKEIPAVM
jgi:acetyl esterase